MFSPRSNVDKSNHIYRKVWDEISYPFKKFNAPAVLPISNFITYFTGYMTTCPCWDLKSNHVSKSGPCKYIFTLKPFRLNRIKKYLWTTFVINIADMITHSYLWRAMFQINNQIKSITNVKSSNNNLPTKINLLLPSLHYS